MNPISTNERKLISSLQLAKHRRSEGLFVVEGSRAVLDTLGLFPLRMLVATPAWLEANAARAKGFGSGVRSASESDMRRMSSMKTPQGVLAVYELPHTDSRDVKFAPDKLMLALDCIQDPGNLGTIIRLADWFGVDTILASADTVDAFSPKVVQATMGAIARVRVVYCDLVAALGRAIGEGYPLYGTCLDGDNIYSAEISKGGIIVMGNEGNGISPAISSLVNCRLLIPSFPPGRQKVESLNVATATAIALAEFRRRAL